MNTLDQLIVAAKDALNAHTFSEDFEAEQNYVPRIEKAKMGAGWHVWLVTADLLSSRRARNRTQKDCIFDVGLIRKLPNNHPDTVNPCVAFADQVQTFFGREAKKLLGHTIVGNEFDPLYSERHLRQMAVFVSVLSLTYRRPPE